MGSHMVIVPLVLLSLFGNSFQRIFQEPRHMDKKIVDATELFGVTRAKFYIDEYQQNNYVSSDRLNERQDQLNKDCLGFTSPTYITFGDCFDWFIYCSGNGVNRMAACPIGDTFSKALGACSETCEAVAPFVNFTDVTQTENGNDDVTTTQGPSSVTCYSEKKTSLLLKDLP